MVSKNRNVRELRNVVEQSIILTQVPVLRIKIPDIPMPDVHHRLGLEEMERNHIVNILSQTNWRVSGKHGAASILKINPKTLESRIKKLGIHKYTCS
jgi:transcriptional regulator with GAF, ATPase, and Fis domain